MDDYQKRKLARKKHYEEEVRGWKQRDCSACSGSGYYDDTDSPECGACDGSGKELHKPREDSRQ